jgi:hypothetical protein
MKLPLLTALPFALLVFAASSALPQEMSDAAKPTEEQIAFFEKKIRPVLVKHCYECHSSDADSIKGGLALDTRDASRRGGESGASVVPFDPDGSLLLAAVSYDDVNLEMPPKYRLEPELIADLRTWIGMGAPDPREGAAGAFGRLSVELEGRGAKRLRSGRRARCYRRGGGGGGGGGGRGRRSGGRRREEEESSSPAPAARAAPGGGGGARRRR